jgi:hypothetical protein
MKAVKKRSVGRRRYFRKKYGPGCTMEQKKDPFVFFLNCIPELYEDPLVKEHIRRYPHCRQLAMVPQGKGKIRNKGPLRKMLKNNDESKRLFEKGMIQYLLMHYWQYFLHGHVPSARDITANCQKCGAIDLVQLLYKCKLFGGSIVKLYEESKIAIKIWWL